MEIYLILVCTYITFESFTESNDFETIPYYQHNLENV